jgi:hypothetical protein
MYFFKCPKVIFFQNGENKSNLVTLQPTYVGKPCSLSIIQFHFSAENPKSFVSNGKGKTSTHGMAFQTTM